MVRGGDAIPSRGLPGEECVFEFSKNLNCEFSTMNTRNQIASHRQPDVLGPPGFSAKTALLRALLNCTLDVLNKE